MIPTKLVASGMDEKVAEVLAEQQLEMCAYYINAAIEYRDSTAPSSSFWLTFKVIALPVTIGLIGVGIAVFRVSTSG